VKSGDVAAALRQWWRDRRAKDEQFAPSDEELRQLSEHFVYEIEMTFDLADVLVSSFTARPTSREEEVVRNALIESFTIHVRQLIDLFWSARSPKWKLTLRDAYAADYFEPGKLDPQWFDRVKPCLDRFEAKYGSA
jgi:hypothetical protein